MGERDWNCVFPGDGGDELLVAFVEELAKGFDELFAWRTDVFSVDTSMAAHGPLAGLAYPEIGGCGLCERGRWRFCHCWWDSILGSTGFCYRISFCNDYSVL